MNRRDELRKSKTLGKHESGGTAKKPAPKKQKVREPPKKKEPKPRRQPFQGICWNLRESLGYC